MSYDWHVLVNYFSPLLAFSAAYCVSIQSVLGVKVLIIITANTNRSINTHRH